MNYSSTYSSTKNKLLKETSYYTSRLRIRELREARCCLSKKHEGLVKVAKCKEGEPICCDESSDSNGPFCFFYATFFKKVLLRFPCPFLKRSY